MREYLCLNCDRIFLTRGALHTCPHCGSKILMRL
jgi:DNA-directed RNA polymerase subunit RPC12/RpoP